MPTFANQHAGRPPIGAYVDSWEALEKSLATHHPKCDPLERTGKATVIRFNPKAETPLVDLLKMSDVNVEAMRHAHTGYVDEIKSQHPELVYAKNSRGIVTTAGGTYFPVVVISIRMLRRTGSRLPVEVFLMAQSEYEEEICNVVLPGLNAKCIILSDIVDAIPHSVEISHYQLKIFAILFSTYEEVIFLDADSLPLHDPETLLKSHPFRETGMVTWPDFWYSTASEKYYVISSQPRPLTSYRATSETGEILISKKTHAATLLLVAYYNYYGPTHYYLLLSQGAAGEGDKETFLAAADVLGQPYYAVSEPVKEIGHWNPDRQTIEGSAMVQYDPGEDSRLIKQGIYRVNDPSIAPAIRAFFVHANFPKFNPSTIFNNGGPTRHRNGTDTSAWTDNRATVERLGIDVEKHFWEEIVWTACNLERIFRDWKEKTDICANAERYWKSVFEGR